MNQRWRRFSPVLVAKGILLGAVVWVGFVAQTIGLQTVPAPRAAFITGTAVLIVPVLAPLFRQPTLRKIDWIAAGVATVGLFLLVDPAVRGITLGDAWIALCALSVALHILLLQIVSQQNYDTINLAFLQIFGITLCSFVTLPWTPTSPLPWTLSVWVAIGVCGILASFLVFILLTRYQKETSPQRAAVIFSMEPVFATFFAYLLLAEMLTLKGFFGALFILTAIVGSGLKRPSRKVQSLP